MQDVYEKMRLAVEREGLDESVVDQIHEVRLATRPCAPRQGTRTRLACTTHALHSYGRRTLTTVKR